MYGKRRSSSRFTSRRAGGALGGRRRTTFKKMGRRFVRRPRFATVSFARNVEKKYADRTYQSNAFETITGNTGFPNSQGVTYVSNTWGDYTFNAAAASSAEVSNDMLKGLVTGTTARTRIGNKVGVNYIKGAFTFVAAQQGAGYVDQGGEGFLTGPENKESYLRTTFRFVIVKDMQVNSADDKVTWAQVYDTTNKQAGVHSELNVDNMGRFIVLQDKIFTVDADNPQKTVPFLVSGSKVGHVRYNGPAKEALTDKGIYVIWSAFVMGWSGGGADQIKLASPVGHSRMCFNDS